MLAERNNQLGSAREELMEAEAALAVGQIYLKASLCAISAFTMYGWAARGRG